MRKGSAKLKNVKPVKQNSTKQGPGGMVHIILKPDQSVKMLKYVIFCCFVSAILGFTQEYYSLEINNKLKGTCPGAGFTNFVWTPVSRLKSVLSLLTG